MGVGLRLHFPLRLQLQSAQTLCLTVCHRDGAYLASKYLKVLISSRTSAGLKLTGPWQSFFYQGRHVTPALDCQNTMVLRGKLVPE